MMKQQGSDKKGNLLGQGRFYTMGKIVLMAGILFAAFIFSSILGMKMAVRGKVVQVPPLIGMALTDAVPLSQSLDVNLVVSGQRYDPNVPEGAIISQLPGAGVEIRPKRDVQVVVSLGQRINPVPGLINVSLRAARLMVEQNGYELGKVSEIDIPGLGDDRIISQFPLPDSTENVGNSIDVLVNRSRPRQFVMPDLEGENLNRVIALFNSSGFEVDRIQYRSQLGAARGAVLRQFPEAGYALREDEAVHLEVAR
ncbi:MAG TPA: PASTA domain-containing protein [Acidobacteriota bacterium]|nr:PASTA domain-containing protein [Acidobacteriota bacterium]